MLIRRLRYWLTARQRQAELRTEMESHLEEKISELQQSGMSAPRANAEARRLFGSMALKQEESREIWIARQWSVRLWTGREPRVPSVAPFASVCLCRRRDTDIGSRH